MAILFRRSAPTPDATRALSDRIRAFLQFNEDDGLSVSEIACSHPECGMPKPSC